MVKLPQVTLDAQVLDGHLDAVIRISLHDTLDGTLAVGDLLIGRNAAGISTPEPLNLRYSFSG